MRLLIVFAILTSCTPNSSYKETRSNIFDDKNKLSFSTKKNFKTDSTDIYNLNYHT